MRRPIGIALLVLGVLPVVLVAAGWIVWKDHMYTLGISLGVEKVLAGLLVTAMICLAVGLYLVVASPRTS
jgi:hypothetical protein